MKKKKKRNEIICPYCGRKAVLRQSTFVYKDRTIDAKRFLYVCSGYPDDCDAYVGVHMDTMEPLGTLANGKLRHKRIETHRVFDRLWKEGIMTRNDAYEWLTLTLCFGNNRAHIGEFSDYLCKKTIEECEKVLRAYGKIIA